MLDILTPSLTPPRLKVGGTVGPGYLYVERQADRDLLNALSQGEFCYVLAPRQIGKSSLRHHTAIALEAQGVRCAFIDLSGIGTSATASDTWYHDIIHRLALVLKLDDPEEYWQRKSNLSPSYRFSRYLRDEIIYRIQESIVIFVDEIDTIISLPFDHDDFFAVIREIYNARADEPDLSRLSFCLLGVAAPYDLIQDETRTPFNIGKAIRLRDFTRDEAQEFLPALVSITADPEQLLDEVYRWTNGHPYMTQRLCEAIVSKWPMFHDNTVSRVKAIVEESFLEGGKLDYNLLATERRLRSDKLRQGQMLQIYKEILQGKYAGVNHNSPAQVSLLLSGLVAERQNINGVWCLEVRNPIFATVFDEEWVKVEEAQRLLAEPLGRWLNSSRSADELLRGQNLEAALKRRQQNPEALSKVEHEFIDESVTALSHQEAQERQLRNRRNSIAILVVFLLGVSVALGVALYEQRQAVRAKKQSDEAALKAEEAALAERGLRATMLSGQPGRQPEALVVGLQAVIPSLRRHRQPVPQAAEGLFHAADAITLHEPLRDDAVTAGFESATYSPDGARILTTHMDGTAQVWDAKTLHVLFPLIQNHSSVSDTDLANRVSSRDSAPMRQSRPAQIKLVEFSPDSRHIITANSDNIATVWNATDGAMLMSLPQFAEIRYVGYSPDGKYLIVNSGDWSSAVHLYDAASGKMIFTSSQASIYHRPSESIKFSKNGRYFVAISDWKSLETNIFDANTNHPVFPVGRWVIPRSAALSPDGQYAAVSYWSIPGAMLTPSMKRIPNNSYETAIWNIHSGEPRYFTNLLESLSFSPDGKTLLGTQRNTVQILANYGEVRLTLDHSNEAKSASFSPDGRYILVTTADQQDSVWLWDADSGRLLCRLPAWGVFSAKFSPDGRHIITVNGDRTASIWDIAANRLSYEFRSWSQLQNITSAFSPDSKQLILVNQSANIDTLELQTKIFHQKISHSPNSPIPSFLAFSPTGKNIFLGVGTYESSAELRDAQTGNLLRSLSVGDSSNVAQPYAATASYSPDGGRILATLTNGKAYIFNSETGSIIRVFELPASNDFPYATFSPNGKQILLATSSEISFWEEGDAPLLKLTDGRQMFRHASFSPDGKRVVVSRKDNTAVIWTPFMLPSEPKPVEIKLNGHQGPVNSAYFSPDGKTVITASDDMTARIWDSQSGQILYTLKSHGGPLHYATYSPDGRYVLTISRGGGSRVTDISLSSSLTFACRFLMTHWYRHELRRSELAEMEQFCSPYM